MPAPLVVCQETELATPAAAELADAGWRLQAGFGLPEQPWDVSAERRVCVGTVSSRDDEDAALLAAVRGAGLLVVVAHGPSRNRFLDDLAHVGPVGRSSAPHDEAKLDEQERELLRRLARGESIEGAARALGLSRRTAHRRLARARALLGVTTTTAAVARFTSAPAPVPHRR